MFWLCIILTPLLTLFFFSPSLFLFVGQPITTAEVPRLIPGRPAPPPPPTSAQAHAATPSAVAPAQLRKPRAKSTHMRNSVDSATILDAQMAIPPSSSSSNIASHRHSCAAVSRSAPPPAPRHHRLSVNVPPPPSDTATSTITTTTAAAAAAAMFIAPTSGSFSSQVSTETVSLTGGCAIVTPSSPQSQSAPASAPASPQAPRFSRSSSRKSSH